jgi:hypothetical protein
MSRPWKSVPSGVAELPPSIQTAEDDEGGYRRLLSSQPRTRPGLYAGRHRRVTS